MAFSRTIRRSKFRVMVAAFCCVALSLKLMYSSISSYRSDPLTVMEHLAVRDEEKQRNVINFEITKEINKDAETEHDKTSAESSPLHDYVAFPCANELPPFPEVQQEDRGMCVRTINDSYHEYSVKSAECVPLKTQKGSTPICIHDVKDDKWISQSLKRSGSWESHLVNVMVGKLTADPGMQFLDLGCNIGVYSLSAAFAGKRVVAVDPLIVNLQLLSRSLNIGNLRDHVTLIWNAVANDYREVALLKYDMNVGGTAIQEVNETQAVDMNDLVRTIKLDDLTAIFKGKPLGIKMDVETQELNVLKGGTVFFEQVDVRFIQMEIKWHLTRPSGPDIVEFLAERNLLPYKDIRGTAKLDSKTLYNWPEDVYFVRTGQ